MTVTGLYGGSFNPIHEGHVRLSRAIVETGMVDELWLLVSPQNPLKADQEMLADEARLELAQMAVQNEEKIRVSDFEFHLPRPSYMVHTLQELRRTYPEREFVLVIGADNWERFPRWYHHEEILAHHRLIIYPRPGCTLQNLPANAQVADTPLIDISSTEIREKIQNPSYDGAGLCPAVWEEIKKKGYYR